MTESPYIHHRPTLQRLPGPAVVCPDLEPHQQWSSSVRLGLAAGRPRPVDARGGRSPPACQPHPSRSGGAWAGAGSALVPPSVPSPFPTPEKAPSRPPPCSAGVAINISTHTLPPARAAHQLLMT